MSIPSTTFESSLPAGTVAEVAVVLPTSRRFSVDEYHRMIETGILAENDRVQLIEGWIVEMPPIGSSHGMATTLTEATVRRVVPPGWFVRVQQPITLERGEPEPDISIARGTARDYPNGHPTGGDVALVVEVSDSTLHLDRTRKAREYATAGIAVYWIVNLVDRQLEVHRDPHPTISGAEYRTRNVIDASGSVELVLPGEPTATIQVAELLP